MDKPDLAAVRKAALARRDYVLWIARALEQRAADLATSSGILCEERELLQVAAVELRSLVSHEATT